MTTDNKSPPQHTPGPWKVEKGTHLHAGHLVITAEHAGMDARIPLAHLSTLLGEDEPFADALLIASAPKTAAERDRLKEERFNEQKRWVEFFNLNIRLESERNASRAINAELLEALKSAQDTISLAIENVSPGEMDITTLDMLREEDEKTRTAIAKAEGLA